MLSEKHQLSEQNGPTSQARTDAFANAKQKAQKKLLVIQDAWYIKKTDEIQSYADRHWRVLWLLFSPH